MVGEGDSTLSGGEKQWISIARAILKDAPVLLLDETTSSLDPENELDVQRALEELSRDCAVVMIAHKLKTIADADRILVLDQGRIKESGTHSELMQKSGLYRKLEAAYWKMSVFIMECFLAQAAKRLISIFRNMGMERARRFMKRPQS